MCRVNLNLLHLLIKLLLPVSGICLAGGWVLFQIGQGASCVWLIIPLLMINGSTWWIRRWHRQYVEYISTLQPTQEQR